MRDLPVGVVSADAIEHLEPLALSSPDEAVALLEGDSLELVDASRNDQSPAIALPDTRLLASAPRSGLQVLITAVPLLVVDFLTIFSGLLITAVGLNLLFGFTPHAGLLAQGSSVLLCYFAIGSLMGLFPATAVSPVLELRQLVRSCLMACGLLLLINQVFGTLSRYEILIGLIGGVFSATMLPLTRAVSRYQLAKFSWWGERAIIIGTGSQARAIYRFYSRCPSRGLKVVGVVDFPQAPLQPTSDPNQPSVPYLGSVKSISHLAKRYRIRWGILATAGCDSVGMNEVMKFSNELRNLIVLPSQFLLPSLWSSTRECAGVLGVHLSDHLRSPLARALKRSIDLIGSVLSLLIAGPLMIIFVILIKRQSPGPAFYGHSRIGHNGKQFKAWKLRTMVPDADKILDHHLEQDPELRRQWFEDQKLKNDPRIIPGIGEFLRQTSLDELPQLFNVLKGDMSLVGPRPIVTSEIAKYGEMYPQYLRVVPGITGLWQVSGRNDTSYEQRVRLDSYYVCNWSVWLDAYIAVRTIRTLVLREGAY